MDLCGRWIGRGSVGTVLDMWKKSFIVFDISSDIQSIGSRIKTKTSFGLSSIAKKDALLGLRLQLMCIVGSNVWITSTTKHF